jgi:hypothetical protein
MQNAVIVCAVKQRNLAFKMKCYRRILHFLYEQNITNVEVRRGVGNTRNIVQISMAKK